MEALSQFEADEKQWRRYRDQSSFVIREAKRDLESLHAASLANHLEESLLEGADLRNEIRERLERTMLWLAEHAEPIPLVPDHIRNHLDNRLVIEDLTDNLILHTILHHARSNPDGPLAFASENVQDFDSYDISRQLATLGIRYFRRIDAALGWLASQNSANSDRS